MSTYQDIISSHLKILFERGDNITPVVVIAACERWFVTDLCTQYGYVPAFSPEDFEYLQFVGIKKILPC